MNIEIFGFCCRVLTESSCNTAKDLQSNLGTIHKTITGLLHQCMEDISHGTHLCIQLISPNLENLYQIDRDRTSQIFEIKTLIYNYLSTKELYFTKNHNYLSMKEHPDSVLHKKSQLLVDERTVS